MPTILKAILSGAAFMGAITLWESGSTLGGWFVFISGGMGWLFSALNSPCPLCALDVPACWWGDGHKGHYVEQGMNGPRILVECGSLKMAKHWKD